MTFSASKKNTASLFYINYMNLAHSLPTTHLITSCWWWALVPPSCLDRGVVSLPSGAAGTLDAYTVHTLEGPQPLGSSLLAASLPARAPAVDSKAVLAAFPHHAWLRAFSPLRLRISHIRESFSRDARELSPLHHPMACARRHTSPS